MAKITAHRPDGWSVVTASDRRIILAASCTCKNELCSWQTTAYMDLDNQNDGTKPSSVYVQRILETDEGMIIFD